MSRIFSAALVFASVQAQTGAQHFLDRINKLEADTNRWNKDSFSNNGVDLDLELVTDFDFMPQIDFEIQGHKAFKAPKALVERQFNIDK